MNRAMGQQPRLLARTRNQVVREVSNELLICDRDNDKAHCLSESAALVWKNCNGEVTIPELAGLLAVELKSPVDEDFVGLSLDQLQEFHLLQQKVARPAGVPALSRRQLMKGLGLAAVVALPLMSSIVAPTATQAQTAPPPPPR